MEFVARANNGHSPHLGAQKQEIENLSSPLLPKRPANGFRVNVCYGAPGLCSQKEGGGVLYRILTIKIPPTPHKEKGDHTWLHLLLTAKLHG
ncbi:hypothetical protein CDAR_478411 [Caerostris darwini]|uniref:Uncharacterized protein n=1 Tax=Caerostris darwini TaxID=1538125 RepID=A0AAV4VD67_9ARAC|nr:hypothetical protein CDAR_478411 [Caerostris darwini]